MPLDAFLKLEAGTPLKGESTDNLHKDEIEILSFEQSVKRALSATDTSGKDTKKGTSECSPISILVPLNQTTPPLMQAACAGTVFKKATITLCQPSADSKGKNTDWKRATYFEIVLESVLITRTRLVGDPKVHLPVLQTSFLNSGIIAEMGPIQELDLSYQKIAWLYTGSTPSLKKSGMWSIPERKEQKN